MTTPTDGPTGDTPCLTCGDMADPHTGRCGCPSPGDSATPAAGTPSSVPPGRAESLFENYLAARLIRARRTLTTAKVALLRDPRNREKLEALRSAELETQRLHAQLLQQRRKSAKAHEPAPGPNRAVKSEMPSASADATHDFRLAQAARAEAIFQAAEVDDNAGSLRPDDRHCPKCGRQVPGDSVTCACGYAFVADGSNVGAEPFLSEEDVAALRGKLSKHSE